MKKLIIFIIIVLICLCLYYSKDHVCEKKVIKENFNITQDLSNMDIKSIVNPSTDLRSIIYDDVKQKIIKDINEKLDIKSVGINNILKSIKDIHDKKYGMDPNIYFPKIDDYLENINSNILNNINIEVVKNIANLDILFRVSRILLKKCCQIQLKILKIHILIFMI